MKFKIFFVLFYFVTGDFYVTTHALSELMDTTAEEFPYHAVIHGKLVCNGILISENYVITPAYCVYGASSVTVYLGFQGYPYYTSHHKEPNTQIYHSTSIYIHEDFAKIKDQHYLNNIALIKLATPATLSKKIRPGKLISREEAQLMEGRFVNISGWLVSQDTSVKFATLQLRNQDTCSYLFGLQFLRSQEICVKWKTKNRLNLLGNAVSLDDKIIGFQTNTPSCTVASSSCTRNDMVLYFVPFLDWISNKINIPVSKFTAKEQRNSDNIDLTRITDLIPLFKQIKTECDGNIANLHKKIENIVSDIQKVINSQNNYSLTLDEQLGDIKTEINNSRKQEDQNILKLQEEVNGIRTEITNGLSAQRNITDLETKVENQNNNIQNIINEHIKKLEKQIKDLNNKIENSENINNLKFLQHEQNVTNLYHKIFEVNERFNLIDAITKKYSDDMEIDFLTYQKQQNEYFTKLQKSLQDDISIIKNNAEEDNLRFENIESLFNEQRSHMDKHIVQEKAEIYSLWTELKSLKASITKLIDFIDTDPVPH